MEQLEIHSRSYLVRWVDVKPDHTISWSIQPHKKSINFGIFKHPGTGLAPTPRAPSSSFEAPLTPAVLKPKGEGSTPETHGPHDGPSPAIEKLKSIGMVVAEWHGNCEANVVTTGTYDVGKSGAGMYALVFDNTFSKSLSKTATFVLLTYPTSSAARTHHQARHTVFLGANSTSTSRSKAKSRPEPRKAESAESALGLGMRSEITGPSWDSSRSFAESSSSSSKFHTGILLKRRRKKHQGYARRFFSLDFASSTLSYYHDRRTLSIRGAVPLSLAAIGTNDTSREISIDSGAEVWHLRAINRKDFDVWKQVLEHAAQSTATDDTTDDLLIQSLRKSYTNQQPNPDEDRDWQRVEELVSRVSVTRDLARRLAKDTDPKYLPLTNFPGTSTGNISGYASSSDISPSDFANPTDDYFGSSEKRPFWKRRVHNSRPSILSTARKVSAPSSLPSASTKNSNGIREQSSTPQLQSLVAEEGLHEQCMDLMKNLDRIVNDFSKLIAESKQRRAPVSTMAESRMSMESSFSQEFFDAVPGEGSQLLTIQQDSDVEDESPERDFTTDEHEDSSASEVDEDDALDKSALQELGPSDLYPIKTKSFNLPPISPVDRRMAIPPATQAPPSLIGFLRKNVGKDLSTIAMPVSANEPISLLQKMAERMEYSELLDEAVAEGLSPSQRLLKVAAFAMSPLSSNRAKERSIRKPFNPMLGETYELMREDRGFRFVAEKICHRPVRIAWHAESEGWSVAETTQPSQKFWGKSMELVMEGEIRLALHTTGDRYRWTPATTFLRNIIAGEKYIEPSGSMMVQDEKNNIYAVVEFAKPKGLFAGRSEEVSIRVFRHDEPHQPLHDGLVGKWTTELLPSSAPTNTPIANAAPVWQVGSLVPSAPQCYGFTTFAASLNQIMPRDSESLPPSDSRFRPDQRAAEAGDLDAAESLKVRLEEAQRERRRVMEADGEDWKPVWFSRATERGPAGEDVWAIRGAREGYWESRLRGDWKAAKHVLEA